MHVLRSLLLLASTAFAAPHVSVHGHRGARAVRPENTLPAFEYALRVGVDVLEFDLAVTRDDVVVVSHDPHVNLEICEATGGRKWETAPAIRELTLAELKTFDCGVKKHPRFPKQETVKNTPIPTLEEVFAAVKASALPAAKAVEFNIETKIVPRHVGRLMPEPEHFAKLVVDVVRKAGFESRVIVQSFDHRSLVAVRKRAPKIRIAALLAENFPDWEAIVKKLRPDFLSPNVDWLTAETVKKAQALGVRVVPWTLNEKSDWDYALAAGVDGIITDDPEPLLAYLRERGKHR